MKKRDNNSNVSIPSVSSTPENLDPISFESKSVRFFRVTLTLTLLVLVFISSALVTYKTNQINQVAQNIKPKFKNQNIDKTSDWKIYRNEEIGYEFKYPEKNRYESSQIMGGTLPTLCFFLEESVQPDGQGTACIWTSYVSQASLNAMGITFCSAYSENPRCEQLTIDKDRSFSIDWGPEESNTNKVANAQISHPNGGLVTFTLKPVFPKSKDLFTKILSTFKFLDNNKHSREKGGCTIEGCNSELCVDPNVTYDIYSTCIYKPEYQCYNYSICEKQENGICGWTETEEYKSCLKNYKTSTSMGIQCSDNGGRWLPMYDECENIDEETCTELGGIYSECSSPCRHDFGLGPCIQMCAEVCSFSLDN